MSSVFRVYSSLSRSMHAHQQRHLVGGAVCEREMSSVFRVYSSLSRSMHAHQQRHLVGGVGLIVQQHRDDSAEFRV
jgi:hypothetical protein